MGDLRRIQDPKRAEKPGLADAGQFILQNIVQQSRPATDRNFASFHADQRFSISSHISLTARASPTVTARETIECPIFNSSSPVRSRTGVTLR